MIRRDQQRERDILDRRARGESLYTIADAYGLSHSRVSQILKAAGAPARPRGLPPTEGISTYAIRTAWARFNATPVEVWICPAGEAVQLRIVNVDRWVEGAIQVGTYTSAILVADFADDVYAALAEFRRKRNGGH